MRFQLLFSPIVKSSVLLEVARIYTLMVPARLFLFLTIINLTFRLVKPGNVCGWLGALEIVWQDYLLSVSEKIEFPGVSGGLVLGLSCDIGEENGTHISV